ncbi:MAG: ferrous iron transport protein B [Desulfobulbus sp.]|jgi:ferrous iron transport protein B|uniref:ferrous iron transport protein B n=1 Tax=Desulfobulbus sp. TaxID=895 RepID=UPI00283D3475|nr:ferrous iron transport protein B [Desulfobulbus sp.]MDR2550813.1 ferrous iron transport protein B [Desulfobulbus sp.]
MEPVLTIALAGNPNAGKTTLFNHLTGARQHVGNYPGITVEQKEGYCLHQGKEARVVDLPGTYSLTAYSVEELVARDFLINERPDVVVDVVDSSNLERNLYLSCQFLELGVPLVIALNMIDVAEKRGVTINAEKLSARLGVPVVPIIARSGKGVEAMLDAVLEVASAGIRPQPAFLSYGTDLDQALTDMTPDIAACADLTAIYPQRWLGVKLLENDEQIVSKIMETYPEAGKRLSARCETIGQHLQHTLGVYPEAVIADHRYGYIKSIIHQGVVTRKFVADRLYASDKIDKVVTHRVLGPLIMAGVLYCLYTFTFSYSSVPVEWLTDFFALVSKGVDMLLPDGPFKSLIISGVIDGVGGVFGFVPIIMFMFFGIAVLEDSGYLARVAFMMDRIFHFFGLHGSSVMPFIISGGIAGGCAVPGVMAARTLRSPKERMATLLTVPFMNCGAKLPVLTLLIGAFFSDHQARYMFLATLAAWLIALCVAKILRLTVLKGASTPFVMELPPYRFPTLKGLLIHTWERTWQYMKKAGTVILGISILIWAMMTYPQLPDNRAAHYGSLRQETQRTMAADEAGLAEALVKIKTEEAQEKLRNSFAGRIGVALERVSRWAGIDWRTNIALIGGFAAKEVIVSTLGTAYSLGEVDPEETISLQERLNKDPNWNPVVALAVLAFIMFYSPCFVTVVCIAKESGSWKWAAFSMLFNTLFAFVLAVAIYQIGALLYLR